MKLSMREKAIDLRKEGWSYKDIIAKIGASKSSLSYWLQEVPYIPNDVVRKRISEGPAKSNQVRNEKKRQQLAIIQKNANKQLGKISKRDLFMLGIGLYIGEGTKANEATQFVNSDPNVVKLAMKWFRDIIELDDDHFAVTLHIYPDTVPEDAIRYWSSITGIQKSQFRKYQVDVRRNKSAKGNGRLPYGTAQITIKSCGKPELGRNLHRRISAWMNEAFRHAGIV